MIPSLLKRLFHWHSDNEVAESNKELREYIDHMSTMSAKIALDGRILMVNKTAEVGSGMSREQLFKTNFLEGPWWSFDANVQQRVRENFNKAASGVPISYQEKLLFAGVQIVTITFSLTPVTDEQGNVRYLIAEAQDISALKKTQEDLVKTHHLARLGSWEWNIVTGKIGWSHTMPQLFGLDFKETEMDYAQLLSALPDDLRGMIRQTLKTCTRSPGFFSFDRHLQWGHEQPRWLHVQGEVFFDEGKKPIRVEGTVQEITERMKGEEALKESEARFRTLFESNIIGIVVANLQGSVTEANDAFLQMVGYSREDLVSGKVRWDELTPDAYNPWDEQALDQLQRIGSCTPYEKEYIRKDGKHIPVLVGGSLQKDLNQYVAFILDLTERKRMENHRLLLAQEKEKRNNAEQAHQRANFLAQASLLLSSSLDYEDTLKRLARLLSVSLADWCVIYLTDDDKNIRRSIAAHPDRVKEEEASQFFQRYVGSDVKHLPVMRVLSTGRPEIIAETTEEALKGSSYDPVHLEFARRLGFHSVMTVPLVVRGQTLGAIEYVAAEASRAYEDDDLAMAEEISHYAGVAVENARLYTEKKRSEQAARTLADIVESSDDAIIGETLDGRITSWNTGAEKLYGYKAEEMIGQTNLVLVSPDRADESKALIEQLKAGQKVEHFDTVRIKKDEARINVSLTISLIRDASGHLVGFSTIARDVTERKRYEDGLAKARDAAIASDRMKSEFVANVSHEVRTPMNGIIGMTTLLLDTKLTPKQRDFAETIRSSSDTLLTIVNDILDFSKIEAGKMSLEIQDFDLSQVLESTVEFLAPRAHFKGLELISTIAHDVPITLRGDPARLRQVLTNFIGNSVKFTEKGEVAVQATKIRETDSHVTLQLSVTDTGIGIPVERQGYLFQPFNQLDASATRKYGGTGLGLAISKRFVELMGGEIGVVSDPGKGSTFWFQLTLEKQKNRTVTPIEPHADFSTLRVLVVDENPAHRDSIIYQLNAWDVGASAAAADSADAMEILKQEAAQKNPYQVILINQQNHADALVLAKEIKTNPALSVNKVILMTMVNQPVDTHVMREAGVSACLSKPIKPAALFECLVPATKKAEDKPLAHRLTNEKPRRRRSHILVVEDNAVNQKVMLQQLENLGYTADAVGNGLEAVQALEHVPYDLVLMDCQMPEMDGYAATAIIRKRERQGVHLPVIAMTAHVMTGDREKCLAAGMDDYIPKPIKTENLKAMLDRWDGSRAAPEVLAAQASKNGATNPLSDPQFVHQVSQLFLKETPKYLKAMKRALASRDAKGLYVAAHTLAGSCCIVGTQEIKSICRLIEAKAQSRKIGGTDELVKELDQEFEVVQQTLDGGLRRRRHENPNRR